MIRAFVSSTYVDLKEHRAYVIGRLTAAGIFVDPMEKWTAASDDHKELSMARVKDCHQCILMGFASVMFPRREQRSITQMEYGAEPSRTRRRIPKLKLREIIAVVSAVTGEETLRVVLGVGSNKEVRHHPATFAAPLQVSAKHFSGQERAGQGRGREGEIPVGEELRHVGGSERGHGQNESAGAVEERREPALGEDGEGRIRL